MLAIDEESPWILHRALVSDRPDLPVSLVIEILNEIVEKGWAEAWIPVESAGDPNAKGRRLPSTGRRRWTNTPGWLSAI
jgi:hypothetical protein